MNDVALVENGVVVQVWRSKPIEEVIAERDDDDTGLVEFPSTTADKEVVCGMLWDGSKLTVPPLGSVGQAAGTGRQ